MKNNLKKIISVISTLLALTNYITLKSQQASAFDFDGVDDYIDFGPFTALKPSGGLTVEMWVYKPNWSASAGESFISNTQLSGYAICIFSGNLRGQVYRNGNYGIVSTPVSGISSGWHHIALTFDGRYTKLYLDGSIVGTDDAGGNYSITYISNNTFLGAEASTGSTPEAGQYMLGRLDEVRISGYAKSYCAIESDRYKSGYDPSANCEYHFTSGTVGSNNTGLTTLYDSHNVNHGSVMNAALNGGSSNWAAGTLPNDNYQPFLYFQTPALPCTGVTTTIVIGTSGTYTWNGTYVGSTNTVSVPASINFNVAWPNSGCTTNYNGFVPQTGIPSLYINPSINPICKGETSTLVAVGTVDTYTWNNSTNASSLVITPNGNGNRSVTGTSTLTGCTASAVISITVNPIPTVAIVPSSTVVCSADNVTLTATGASSYIWSNGSTTLSTANPFITSPNSNYTRTVTGIDANGCSDTATQSIVVNTSPTVSISASGTNICSGESVTLTASGANTYTWTNGPTSAVSVVSPTTTTTYTVTGKTTSSGCTDIAAITISVKASPNVNITPSSTLICSADNVTLSASGATSYTWSNGLGNNATVVLGPNVNFTRTVVGEAANGCTNQAVQSISVNTTPVITTTSSGSPICSGSSATLTASGASTYTWNGVSTGSAYIVSPTITTTYTVLGSTSGCTNQATRNISVNALPNVNIIASSSVICSTSTATLTASGANTYTWSNSLGNNATVTLSPNSTINRSVIGTAANGCTNQAVQTISVNTSPVVTITSSGSPICAGQSATLTASGANTYTWNGVSTGSVYIVTPTTTTSYTVVGKTSASGCTDQATGNISVNASPTVIIIPSSTVSCSAENVTLTASGANTYLWSNGTTTTATWVISPNSTITRTVVGTAANGCTNQAVQTISVNASPVVNISSSSTVICSGSTVTLTASGANTYSWSGGPSTSTRVISPTVTTIYTVTGTNTLGNCTDIATQSVLVYVTPTINIAYTSSVICSTKTTTLTASGANSYIWTGGPSSATYTVSPNSSAIYTVTGTNTTGGCTNTATQNIVVNPTPTLNIAYTSSVICSGKTTTLTASGANSYAWTSGPSAAANPVSPNANTVYTVTGTNTAGSCTSTATQSVVVNASPTLNIAFTSSTICSGKSTTLTASGANSYVWTSGPSTAANAVSPNATTVYTVTGTNTAGSCTNTATQNIVVNATPTINIAYTSSVICSGNTATLTASGANTYSWSNAISTSTNAVSPNVTTVYTITGTTTASGCTNTAVQTVSVNSIPVLTVTPTSPIICSGNVSNLLASGATNYTWTNGPQTAAFAASPTLSTTYTVTGETAGCEGTASVAVTVNQNPTVTVNSGTICTGNSFTVMASGANSYSWSTGASTSSIVVTPPSSTVYIVTGTGTNNCVSTATSNVVVGNNLVVTIVPSSTVVCAGSSVTLTASGGNNFLWNNSATSSSITVNPTQATTYSVIGSSGPSCSNTASQLISINPSPTLTVSGTNFICTGFTSILTAGGANSYTWNTGANTTTISVTPTISTTYTVSGSNSFNCTNTAIYQVQTTPVITPSICLVTVDSSSIYNEIYWEKGIYPEADTFIVYRETSASVYSAIARLSKNDPGFYADTNRSMGLFNGNPNYTSYKYKIQIRDTCGNLSPMSPYHETIFIQDNQTGNFNWNYYFIEGLGPQLTVNYVLYRRNVLTGITTSVNATGGTALTDPIYASVAATGNVKWFVGMSGFACDPNTRLTSTAAATISTTKSNDSNEKQYPVTTVGLQENNGKVTQFRMYPNPVENELTLNFGKNEVKLDLELLDVSGRLIRKDQINGTKFYLKTATIKNGIYFITLYEGNKLINTQKIIVQHP